MHLRDDPARRDTGADGVDQAAHVNVCLFMRGLLRHLYTRIYFAGDPALERDPLLALVPEARRPTLLGASPAADGADVGLRLSACRVTPRRSSSISEDQWRDA